MKKTILIVSLFSVFLMLMMPNLTAVENRVIKDEIQNKISQEITLFNNNVEEIKDLISSLDINLNLLLSILINGIILPIIWVIIVLGIVNLVAGISPLLANLIAFIGGFLMSMLFINPLMTQIIEETGRIFISVILSMFLIFFDNIIANNLFSLLFP
jgi:hypothetical protein